MIYIVAVYEDYHLDTHTFDSKAEAETFIAEVYERDGRVMNVWKGITVEIKGVERVTAYEIVEK